MVALVLTKKDTCKEPSLCPPPLTELHYPKFYMLIQRKFTCQKGPAKMQGGTGWRLLEKC